MSVHRTGRRPGRPQSGAEPLDRRFTVMLTATMDSRLEQLGSHKADFVRRAIHRAFFGGQVKRVKKARRRKVGRRTGRVRRYT